MWQTSPGKLYRQRVHVHRAGIVGIEWFAFASTLCSPDIIRRRGRISCTGNAIYRMAVGGGLRCR